MGGLSIWHWMIVLAVVLLLFGGSGKVSTLMGDFAKGMKSFKRNMAEDESMEAQNRTAGTQPSPTPLASPSVGQAGVQSGAPVQEPVRHS